MKRWILLFTAVSLVLGTPALAAEGAPETSAKAMILIHGASGRVLAEKDPDESMLIASTTKLMTALVCARTADLTRETEIRPEWTAVEGSSMYLRPGERYTLRELLEGLLLASGNDAALAIAETVADSAADFVEQMNRTAEELGMSGTHFANPHGLDAPDHFSTARDLAMLMTRVMDCAPLREILSLPDCSVHGVTYGNHNKLLGRCEGVNGGKTGYTKAAGRCLVTSCERDGLALICVTLSDPDDWDDHARLYDWAFARFAAFSPAEEVVLPAVPLVGSEREAVSVRFSSEPVFCLERDGILSVRLALPSFVFAPVEAGSRAGTAELFMQGETVASLPLVWAEDAPARSGAAEVLASL